MRPKGTLMGPALQGLLAACLLCLNAVRLAAGQSSITGFIQGTPPATNGGGSSVSTPGVLAPPPPGQNYFEQAQPPPYTNPPPPPPGYFTPAYNVPPPPYVNPPPPLFNNPPPPAVLLTPGFVQGTPPSVSSPPPPSVPLASSPPPVQNPPPVAQSPPPPPATSLEASTLLIIQQALGNASLTNWSPNSDPCTDQWQGVTCTNGSVSELSLSGSGLKGTVPAGLSNLTSLQTLNLSNNSISGTLPTGWGSNGAFSNLGTLNFEGNRLTGPLPGSFGGNGSFPKLTLLNLGSNLLNGSLPSAYGSSGALPALQILSLKQNKLSGSLPSQWGAATGLRSLALLALDANQLTGPLPGQWSAGWPTLSLLSITENQLTGTLPPEWAPGGWPLVQIMALYSNNLAGTFPTSWAAPGSFPAMRGTGNGIVLQPGNAGLRGAIPSNLSYSVLRYQGGSSYLMCRQLPCTPADGLSPGPSPLSAPTLAPFPAPIPSPALAPAPVPAPIPAAVPIPAPSPLPMVQTEAVLNIVGPGITYPLTDAQNASLLAAVNQSLAGVNGISEIRLGNAQSLADAAPAPATITLPVALRRLAAAQLQGLADDDVTHRHLLQSTPTGVQIQVIVQGASESADQVAAALQSAVSSGQFQASLQEQGLNTTEITLGALPPAAAPVPVPAPALQAPAPAPIAIPRPAPVPAPIPASTAPTPAPAVAPVVAPAPVPIPAPAPAPALVETEAFINIQGPGLASPLSGSQSSVIVTALREALSNVSGITNLTLISDQSLESAAPAPKTVLLPVLPSSPPPSATDSASPPAAASSGGTSVQALTVAGTGRRLQQSRADGVQVRALITALEASAEEVAAALQAAFESGAFLSSLQEGGLNATFVSLGDLPPVQAPAPVPAPAPAPAIVPAPAPAPALALANSLATFNLAGNFSAPLTPDQQKIIVDAISASLVNVTGVQNITLGNVVSLDGAAPAPSVQQVAIQSLGRRLMQSGGGVQVQVNVQSSADLSGAVAAALEKAVSSGQFQATLSKAGLNTSAVTLGDKPSPAPVAAPEVVPAPAPAPLTQSLATFNLVGANLSAPLSAEQEQAVLTALTNATGNMTDVTFSIADVQNLATAASVPSFQQQAPVTGRRLAGDQHSRHLAQDARGGVQVRVLVQAPTDVSDAVARAVEQATSSGQFQAALNRAGLNATDVTLGAKPAPPPISVPVPAPAPAALRQPVPAPAPAPSNASVLVTFNLVGSGLATNFNKTALLRTVRDILTDAKITASISLKSSTNLSDAAPAPQFEVTQSSTAAESGRRLLQASSGVQARVNIAGAASTVVATQTAITDAVDRGTFLTALQQNGQQGVNDITIGNLPASPPPVSPPPESPPPAPASPPPVPIPAPAPKGGSSTAAIAGGVAGGVVAVLAAGSVWWFCIRKKRRAGLEASGSTKATPDKKDSPTSSSSEPMAPNGHLKTDVVPYAQYRRSRLEDIRLDLGLPGTPGKDGDEHLSPRSYDALQNGNPSASPNGTANGQSGRYALQAADPASPILAVTNPGVTDAVNYSPAEGIVPVVLNTQERQPIRSGSGSGSGSRPIQQLRSGLSQSGSDRGGASSLDGASDVRGSSNYRTRHKMTREERRSAATIAAGRGGPNDRTRQMRPPLASPAHRYTANTPPTSFSRATAAAPHDDAKAVRARRTPAQVEEDLQALERAAGIRNDDEEEGTPAWDGNRNDTDGRSESGFSAPGSTGSSRLDANLIAERYRNRSRRAKQASHSPSAEGSRE